jgi:hypothetical protein
MVAASNGRSWSSVRVFSTSAAVSLLTPTEN